MNIDKSIEIKYCEDCDYYYLNPGNEIKDAICTKTRRKELTTIEAERLISRFLNPMTVGANYYRCSVIRSIELSCGPDGVWFSPKEGN